MSASKTQEVTELLHRWGGGDQAALEELTPIIYAELHRTAKRYMSRERENHTLQTSALVNEAYFRLIDWKTARWEDRAHFFGVSAQLMRRGIVDFARKRPKVSDEIVRRVSLEEAFVIITEKDADLVALDEALNELAAFDERREWQKAKAWLYRELSKA